MKVVTKQAERFLNAIQAKIKTASEKYAAESKFINVMVLIITSLIVVCFLMGQFLIISSLIAGRVRNVTVLLISSLIIGEVAHKVTRKLESSDFDADSSRVSEWLIITSHVSGDAGFRHQLFECITLSFPSQNHVTFSSRTSRSNSSKKKSGVRVQRAKSLASFHKLSIFHHRSSQFSVSSDTQLRPMLNVTASRSHSSLEPLCLKLALDLQRS
jgi:hypothetical protein